MRKPLSLLTTGLAAGALLLTGAGYASAGADSDAAAATSAAATAEPYKVLVVGKTLGFRHSHIDDTTNAVIKLGQEHGFTVDVWDPPTVAPPASPRCPWRRRPSPAPRRCRSTRRSCSPRLSTARTARTRPAPAPSTTPSFAALPGLHPPGRRLRRTPRRHRRDARRPVVQPAHRRRRALPQPPGPADRHDGRGEPEPPVDRRCCRRSGRASTSGTTSRPTRALTSTSCSPSTSRPTTRAAAMGADHPIAWCHNFEGGRSWYEGAGHVDASYTDPLFLDHLLGGIEWTAGVVEGGGNCVTFNEVDQINDRPPATGGNRDAKLSSDVAAYLPRRRPRHDAGDHAAAAHILKQAKGKAHGLQDDTIVAKLADLMSGREASSAGDHRPTTHHLTHHLTHDWSTTGHARPRAWPVVVRAGRRAQREASSDSVMMTCDDPGHPLGAQLGRHAGHPLGDLRARAPGSRVGSTASPPGLPRVSAARRASTSPSTRSSTRRSGPRRKASGSAPGHAIADVRRAAPRWPSRRCARARRSRAGGRTRGPARWTRRPTGRSRPGACALTRSSSAVPTPWPWWSGCDVQVVEPGRRRARVADRLAAALGHPDVVRRQVPAGDPRPHLVRRGARGGGRIAGRRDGRPGGARRRPAGRRSWRGRSVSSVVIADDVERVREVVGVRATRTRRSSPRLGVLEAEAHGVQPLPLEPEPLGQGRVGAVGQVADAGVLERAMCTRIWWVRPVSRWTSSRLAKRCASSVS